MNEIRDKISAGENGSNRPRQIPDRVKKQQNADHSDNQSKPISGFHTILMVRHSPNAQLTDGGPPLTPVLPSCFAGPPFGEGPGSVRGLIVRYAHHRAMPIRGAVIFQSYSTWAIPILPNV